MHKRFVRVGLSFVIVLVAYGLYALIGVRFIEPRFESQVRASEGGEITDQDLERPRRRKHRHDALLAKLFEKGAWEREGPKVLESDQAMLLLDEHRPVGEKTMEIVPCTILFFPEPRGRTDNAPQGNPIILRAPEGAELVFDSPLDLTRFKVGRLIGGRLRGEVTIFRHASAPGARDALEVVTRDVQLDQQRIQTPHRVRFRFGQSYGSGQDLIISLLPAVEATSKHTPAVGGIHSLELVHVDKVQLQIAGRGLLPGLEHVETGNDNKVALRPQQASPQNLTAAAVAGQFLPNDPPIEITCDGPFFFDAVNHVARFEEHVDVLRHNLDGQSDQLTCELLEIRFKEDASEGKSGESNQESSTPPGTESRHQPESHGLSTIKPHQIVATGHPVTIRSPNADAFAQGDILIYHIPTRRLRIQGKQPVFLRYGTNEIRAPAVQYEPVENMRLGRVWAAGPGSFRGTLRRERTETLQANWEQALHLRPHDRQHVLSLRGQAFVEFTEAGSIGAEELHLWIKPEEGPTVRNADAPSNTADLAHAGNRNTQRHEPAVGGERLLPQRMKAVGNVTIDSTQLTGRTQQLEVWIRYQTADDRPAAVAVRPGTGRQHKRLSPDGSRRAAAPLLPGVPAAATAQTKDAAIQKFDITGELLRVSIFRAGETTSVEHVSVKGGVRFVETQTAEPGEIPFELTGDQVDVFHANGPDTTVAILGKPAHVRGRGLVATGNDIQLDRGKNHMEIRGPGQMQLPVDRDLDGEPLAQPKPLHVAWKDHLRFDGRTAHVVGRAAANTDTQRALAETMEVSLTRQLDFARPEKRDGVNVRGILMRGGVWLENRTVVEGKLESVDHLDVKNLSVDQVTGIISAEGPGRFTTVRRGDAAKMGALSATPARPAGPVVRTTATPVPPTATRERPAAAPVGDPAEEDGLTYLRIDFLRGITGNLHQQELRFEQQVRVVYGPVEDWDQAVDADSPDGLGPEDALVHCDTLHLAQIGPRRGEHPPFEVTATGNTVVEGGQKYTARAHRITYVQAKDLLVLEGDGRSDAQLWRQTTVGGDWARTAGRKILYWRGTNEFEFDDFRFLSGQAGGR
jgi:hypothetical protein